ncbi:hypothetical protein Vretimale_4131 [Volvox reticuliferus]|uniref:Glycosyltransferase family 92 protein n=1 Tax=Volvox reticuliferus TaxID=1737510 RepID=A0A8J4C373_9CHLO|nr:hypothetical protein Vretifemale_2715 [Volvox reticuliferus]GIL98829.1 hypothetical protein Vretimale_4131 [Volvox reticuliferus]
MNFQSGWEQWLIIFFIAFLMVNVVAYANGANFVKARRQVAKATHSYVAVCMITKNEHYYIRDFIKYHYWIGIQKFYIWDHKSRPSLAYVLEDYVLANVVEIIYFSDSWKLDEKLFREMYNTSTRTFLSPQAWAYDNCFRMFAHRHTFIALLDPDEYIILKEPPQLPLAQPNISSFLAPFEPYGGITVHWQLFGPSGHMVRPNGSALASYTQCIPRERLQLWKEFDAIPLGFTKSITATRCYQRGCNPHLCELKPGCKYVNEDFMDLTPSVIRELHWDRIAIFHYVTRSATEYRLKLRRGSGHSQYHQANKIFGRTSRGWTYFHLVNTSATATCEEGRHAWQRCCTGQRMARARGAPAAAARTAGVAAAASTAGVGAAAAS